MTHSVVGLSLTGLYFRVNPCLMDCCLQFLQVMFSRVYSAIVIMCIMWFIGTEQSFWIVKFSISDKKRNSQFWTKFGQKMANLLHWHRLCGAWAARALPIFLCWGSSSRVPLLVSNFQTIQGWGTWLSHHIRVAHCSGKCLCLDCLHGSHGSNGRKQSMWPVN